MRSKVGAGTRLPTGHVAGPLTARLLQQPPSYMCLSASAGTVSVCDSLAKDNESYFVLLVSEVDVQTHAIPGKGLVAGEGIPLAAASLTHRSSFRRLCAIIRARRGDIESI